MADRTLPGIGLKGFWNLGEDGWKTDNDLNLLILSVLVGGQVLDLVATEPGTPTDGQVYLLDETHATHPNQVAIRDAGAWVYVAPLTGALLYDVAAGFTRQFNGTAWAAFSGGGGGSTDYIVGFFFTTTPTASEVLALHVAGVAFTIPANFTAGLESSVGTNPTASFALDVQKNGSTIGAITVGTDGTVTATTSGGTSKSIAAGDVLKIVAPGSADTTAANMAFTIIGAR